MGDDNQNNENKPNSKLGSYWIYAVIALVLIGLNVFSINNASNDPILWNRFREMVLSGDVKNIEVINEKMVYVYIKDEKLKDEKYKDAAQSNFGGNRPNYIFEIGSVESFESKLADLQKDIPDSQRLYP
ncbi:MAG TPA: ATP-dependent metallopeptidase FtsH/Yme1/Tma family protein, partial [Saprospiraceae bacterium]|nr:ATP-dependent metallopeptidase FtsH/Yme1/Tma family protein [Saprospiraceae bacterium]